MPHFPDGYQKAYFFHAEYFRIDTGTEGERVEDWYMDDIAEFDTIDPARREFAKILELWSVGLDDNETTVVTITGRNAVIEVRNLLAHIKIKVSYGPTS